MTAANSSASRKARDWDAVSAGDCAPLSSRLLWCTFQEVKLKQVLTLIRGARPKTATYNEAITPVTS